MKWYYWVAIGVALLLIIWFIASRKKTTTTTTLATANPVTGSGFNPYNIIPITRTT